MRLFIALFLALSNCAFVGRTSRAQDSKQNIEDVIDIFESNPDSAFAIASHYHIPKDAERPDYERFLQLIAFINYPKLSDAEFAKYVMPLIGTEIVTAAQPITSVTRRDSGLLQFGIYEMPLAGERTLQYELLGKPLRDTSEDDYFIFTGNVAGVTKTSDGYRVQLTSVKAEPVAGGDVVSDDEEEKLITALRTEHWKEAARLSADYGSRFKVDPYGQHASLRFMHLYAIAGMASRRQMTYAELDTEISGMEGLPVVLPAREFTTREYGGLNQVTLNHDTASITCTDSAGAHIHLFIYARLLELPKEMPKDGDYVKIMGFIDTLESNPNKSEIWVLRMRLDKGWLSVQK